MVNKARTSAFGANSVSASKFSTGSPVDIPRISSIAYSGDDTATNTAGGDTITINGSFFKSGCYVFVDRTQASVVSFISSTQITFTAPAKSAGTYTLYVYNPDGGTAIYIPGISYSGTPTWSTAAGSIGTAYETVELSSNVSVLSASSNSTVKYRLYSGSLPTNAVLNTDTGAITGVTASVAGATTYTFVIEAYDLENQGTLRTFSITINPDVVTWNSPANGNTITVNIGSSVSQSLNASSIIGKTITYTANTLPTGLSISGNTVIGTPTVGQTITSLLTATAATTSKFSTRILNWIINATDSYFPYVSLLLKTTTQSTRSTTTTDSSVNNLTVTRVGSPSTAWTSPYQTDGYWSNYLNGSSYINFASLNSFLTTGPCTIEAWINYSSFSTTPVIVHNFNWNTGQNCGWNFGVSTTGKVTFTASTGTFNTFPSVVTTTTSITTGTWYHVAFVRDASNVCRIYINGVDGGGSTTYASSFSLNSGTTFRGTELGRNVQDSTNTSLVTGYVSNLRIVNGTAVYTTTFTPPTSPLTSITGTSLLTCQSNRLIDKSTNNFSPTLTGSPQTTPYYYPSGFTAPAASVGAAYFNGTSDYITASSITPPGTGSVTYECWFYITSLPNSTVMNSRSGNTTDGIDMIVNSSGKIAATYTSVGLYTGGNFTIGVNTWYHLAFVRNGSSNWTVYVNGQVDGTFTSAVNITSTTFTLGLTLTGTSYFPGYISNVRVTNSPVYTGTFTPPTNFLTQTGGTYPSTANVDTSITSSNTKLLLNFSDSNYTSLANTANNNAFVDSSPYAFPITRTGSPTQGSFTPYWPPDGYWGGYFNGNYISTSTASANLRLDQGNWTMEFWLYLTAWSTNNRCFDTGANGDAAVLVVGYDSTGLIGFGRPTAGTGVTTPVGTITLGRWYHIAMTSEGAGINGRVYVDGVLKAGPVNYTNPTGTTAAFNIGRNNVSGWGGLVGYMNNFRFVSGQRLYTANFTPQTTPLNKNTYSIDGGTSFSNITGTTQLLTLQNNRFIDGSNNNFTFTNTGGVSVSKFQPNTIPSSYNPPSSIGSGYFPLTSTDYIQLPASSAFAPGTGDFTLECWVYATSGTDNYIWTQTVSGTNYFLFGFGTTAYFYMTSSGGGTAINGPASSILLNSWNHVAVTRSNGTVRVFVNGVSGTATTNTTNLTNVSYLPTIGRYSHTNLYGIWTGFISNLRYVKGTAVYISNFTPPTSPLTAIPNTSALLNYANGGIYDASLQNDLITISNAQVSNTTSKWSPTSMKFNGSTDYLYYPGNQIFNFGSSDFTVESWIYLNAMPTSDAWPTNYNLHMVLGTVGTPNLGNGTGFIIGQTKLLIQINDTQYASTTHGLTTGTWYHIAYVRYGNNFYFYVNGVAKGSVAYSSSAGTGSGTYIGCETGQGAFFNGYMQDLRVTKTARYTSAFSVPTSEFITR